MLVHTKQGDLVYEPFMGSGSQLMAAAQWHRRRDGMEISPTWCDVIRNRYAPFTREPTWAAPPELVKG